jgi:hypothetical protein
MTIRLIVMELGRFTCLARGRWIPVRLHYCTARQSKNARFVNSEHEWHQAIL